MTNWLVRRAALVLAFSAVLHVLLTVTATDMFDLRVYYQAAPELLHGRLYDFRLPRADTGATWLPFTYPPFAALVFLPLSCLPWWFAVLVWHTLSLVATVVLVRGSLRLLPPGSAPYDGRHVQLWTAAALWLEPIRHGLALGQIGLILGALSLWAATRRRAWVAGAGIGVSAGVKLTPAVCTLYFLAARKWTAAGWAALLFLATVAVAAVVALPESLRYWGHAMGDTSRIGPTAAVENQSLRGCMARLMGEGGPWWPLAVVAAAAVAGPALRAAGRRGDTLAMLITVQLFGLLVSPVSWSHHWVWALPALIWLGYGPARGRPAALVAGAAWTIAMACWIVPVLHKMTAQPMSWYLAVATCAYPLCAALTFAAVAEPSRATGPGNEAAGAAAPGDGRAARDRDRAGRVAETWPEGSYRSSHGGDPPLRQRQRHVQDQ